jgi:hypothetical protein
MLVFALLTLGCGPEKEAPEPEAHDSAEQTIDPPTDTPSTNPDSIRPLCLTQTYKYSYNGEVTQEVDYTWDGFIQEATDWHAEYNDYGYITKSNSSFDGYISNVIISYECEGWCKVVNTYHEDGTSPEDIETTETQYNWEGNTQYQVGHGWGSETARYWKYNEMGYVIEYYDEGDGYNSMTTNEYSCNDYWCQLEKATNLLQMEGQDPTESIIDYTWEGNRQTSENGSTLYNEYGYVLENEILIGDSSSQQEYTYVCDGE